MVHGVNRQGVMGSGVAKEVRNNLTPAFDVYTWTHREVGLQLGNISHVWIDKNRCVINAVTQNNFGRDPNVRYVNYNAVAVAFNLVRRLMDQYYEVHPTAEKLPLVFPKIGTGYGNGNWRIISTIIDEMVPDRYEKILYVTREEADQFREKYGLVVPVAEGLG